MLISLSADAVELGQVAYVGGTVPVLKEGVVGRLDMVSETSLRFEYSGTALAIPYAKIESFEYSQEVAHHLGVLPAVAIGLLKRRERKHFFRITFRDESHLSQVIIFEVSKQMPPTLLAVLRTRAPQVCRAVYTVGNCGQRP